MKPLSGATFAALVEQEAQAARCLSRASFSRGVSSPGSNPSSRNMAFLWFILMSTIPAPAETFSRLLFFFGIPAPELEEPAKADSGIGGMTPDRGLGASEDAGDLGGFHPLEIPQDEDRAKARRKLIEECHHR